MAQYSPLLPEPTKADIARSGAQQSVKERFQRERLPLSELPQFLNKQFRLEVPVFTVWGACEDVSVLEKLRSGEYKIENLHVIDESHSRLLDVGGVKLRLLGLGGAVVMHKMFDNGEGRTTIAGGQGTMWTTILQVGELIDTANRVYDPTETRVLVTHASPAREGLLNQLSVALKADFSISAGLHFRYGSSYNEFSVNPSLDHYRGKLSASKAQFNDVWETVKHEVEPAVGENESQNKLLQLALELVGKMPATASGGNPFGGGPPNGQVDESAFKNMWNFNLADAAFGWLVLDIDQGRIGTEMRAQGFNFSHRGGKASQRPQIPAAPSNASMAPTGGNLPTPGLQQPPMAQQQERPPPTGPASQTTIQQPPPQQAGQPPMTQRQVPETAQSKPGTQHHSTGATHAQQKPGTPSTQLSAALTATVPQTNGTPSTETPKPAERPNHVSSPHPHEPSKGIFISNVPAELATADAVKKELFTADDAAKIERVERQSPGRWAAHFADVETMRAVLAHGLPKEAKEKYGSGKPGQPPIRMVEYRAPRYGGAGAGGATPQWGMGRGGASAARGGAAAERGGYQSAGGTTGSDSEGGRGGRGARGRGGYRGERGGRGRGGGGRGGNATAGKTEGGASSATPTPASGGGGGDS